MSDDKPEMLTVDVPVEWATCYTAEVRGGFAEAHQPTIYAKKMIRGALDARKSKYEHWREGLVYLPWVRIAEDQIGDSGDSYYGGLLNKDNVTSWQAQLFYAAPQLLDALIGATDSSQTWSERYRRIANAIRAAVPEDVADEILGES